MRRKKQTLIDRMEKRFGRFAIKDLGKYIIAMYSLGSIISFLNESFYNQWLALDFTKVFDGQVWRLITFMMQPPVQNIEGINFLLCLISLGFYFWVFNTLEKAIGTFRLNLYYFSGVVLNVLVTLVFFIIIYVTTGQELSMPTSLYYVNQSLFLAFAVLFPNVQVYLMMMVPVKMKWAAVVWAVFMAYDFIRIELLLVKFLPFIAIFYLLMLVVSLINFVVFSISYKRSKSTGRAHKKMKRNFDKKIVESMAGARHKCCICGRTELDDDSLEFRFCSKCKGNKEYCNVHLFTHQHVK